MSAPTLVDGRRPLAKPGLVERRRGLLSLAGREVLRVLKLWTQTVAAPVMASFLFILVFGLSLSGRIRHVDGVDYRVFIVPGPDHHGDGPGRLHQQLLVGVPGPV